MKQPVPDFAWYAAESVRHGLKSPRCPFQNVDSCPRYYQSLALLGSAGSTSISPEEDRRLLAKWQQHHLWPTIAEQTPTLAGGNDGPLDLINFCPEVTFDRHGLFATYLAYYADELDAELSHERLHREAAPSSDPAWTWQSFTPQHYAACPLYSQLTHGSQNLLARPPSSSPATPFAPGDRYDVFISHASEDKDDFVRPLAAELERRSLRVWFDEMTLKLGDSLRQEIDKGLASSDYGVVVLSQSFFAKEWPQAELNGLFAREMQGRKVILPVWHNITKEELLHYSPLLAAKLAAKSDEGLNAVVSQILAVVRPDQSTLAPATAGAMISGDTAKPRGGSTGLKLGLQSVLRRLTGGQNQYPVSIVAQRFLTLFEEHGIAPAQIPQFLPEVSLDKLNGTDALLGVLTTKVLDRTADLFKIRREWLDGVGDEIYTGHTCYQAPRRFFELLAKLKLGTEMFPVRVFHAGPMLDGRSDQVQPLAMVLVETLRELGEETIHRYHIFNDQWDWGHPPCRIQLKAMARVLDQSMGKITPLYQISEADLDAIREGRRIPRRHLVGSPITEPSLEDYAFSVEENRKAKETEELLAVQHYIHTHRLAPSSPNSPPSPEA